jgi:hypothetical protein
MRAVIGDEQPLGPQSHPPKAPEGAFHGRRISDLLEANQTSLEWAKDAGRIEVVMSPGNVPVNQDYAPPFMRCRATKAAACARRSRFSLERIELT